MIKMKSVLYTTVITAIGYFMVIWGQNGHRIVAQIGYDNLTDKARNEVDGILGDHYLAQIATWPDYIRSEKNWDFAKPWHYMTINPDQTLEQIIEEGKSNPEIENVLEAIELMTAILDGDKVAEQTLKDLMDLNKVEALDGSIHTTALAFLVHFIGDIHQPMHVGKNKDFGGNKIKVLFFDEESNIHSVWDDGIIEKEKLSFTEFADFVDKHTLSKKAEWQKAPIDVWAKESIEVREQIYNTLYDNTNRDNGMPDMSYNYQHDFLPIVEDRLGAAGYRTAAVLNAIYK